MITKYRLKKTIKSAMSIILGIECNCRDILIDDYNGYSMVCYTINNREYEYNIIEHSFVFECNGIYQKKF